MTAAVSLRIDESVDRSWIAPIEHAFRTWAATRGVRVVPHGTAADAALHYGGASHDALPSTTGTTSVHRQDGLPWMFAASTAGPDHLAEVHAWVSARSEHGARPDAIGRAPYRASMPAFLDVDPGVAWASRHLEAFDSVVGARFPGLIDRGIRRAGRPVFMASHDLDFLPMTSGDTARRLVKNVAIAGLRMRDPRMAASIAAGAARAAARGDTVLGGVSSVASLEARHGMRSTWNVIVRRWHRRDGNYDLEDPAVRTILDRLARDGHEIGLHASYTSAFTPGAIAEEVALLADAGHRPVGSRQHWLRHDGVSHYQELSRAGLRYDSSAGWSDHCGFRHGMGEPFVPYDLQTGEPAQFLEVPLVMMDVALSELAGVGVNPRERIEALLQETCDRRGAVSVLWHDTTISDTQVRCGVGGLYAEMLERGDTWHTTREVVDDRAPSWEAAGLPIGRL